MDQLSRKNHMSASKEWQRYFPRTRERRSLPSNQIPALRSPDHSEAILSWTAPPAHSSANRNNVELTVRATDSASDRQGFYSDTTPHSAPNSSTSLGLTTGGTASLSRTKGRLSAGRKGREPGIRLDALAHRAGVQLETDTFSCPRRDACWTCF